MPLVGSGQPANGESVARLFPLRGLVELALDGEPTGAWTTRIEHGWCHVHPVGQQPRQQGWKLHVSATPLSAPVVLTQAVQVLVRHRCAFKFAGDLELVEELVAAGPVGQAGRRFIAAYPDDDDHFRVLAQELDRVTKYLPGPAILADHPVSEASIVSYRYGSFAPRLALDNDGAYVPTIASPDGAPPLHAPASPAPPAVLGGRFELSGVERYAGRAEVYRAIDTRTGAEVIIKEARPHLGATLAGTDARTVLGHQADMLDVLEPTGIAPHKVALFEQGGHLYLAEEPIAGRPLRDWVLRRLLGLDRSADPNPLRLASELVGLVEAAHGAGLVLRDLTPDNIMVTPDGDLRLIDLERAARPGQTVVRATADGYAAPEQFTTPDRIATPRLGRAPGPAADLYSLGATLLYALTGVCLALPDYRPPGARFAAERRRRLVADIAADDPALRGFVPLISALLEEDPADRWDLSRVRAFLTDLSAAVAAPSWRPDRSAARPSGAERPARPAGAGGALAEADQHRLLSDGIAYLLDTMVRSARDDRRPGPPRLWPSGDFGATTDPCNVRHGAAGVLAVLARASRAGVGSSLTGSVGTVAQWLADQLPTEPRVLPGLHFGRSGTAWALHDAATLLGDAELTKRALDVARQTPVNWPNRGISHGAAGAGMAALHLWRATGDPEFADRVRTCADGLVASAVHAPGSVAWPVPRTFASAHAGRAQLGFAHGVAGVGAFLLAAGLETGREEYLDLAGTAGRTLLDAAVVLDGAAWWPLEHTDAEPLLDPGWCTGASGIGTFLVRLWRVTGGDRYRELAELAAESVYRSRWRGSSAACHGLAGDAEFLLDLADALTDPGYRHRAGELAAAIFARRTHYDGRTVVGDETFRNVTVDYGTGLSGVLAMLLRLRDGGPRLWVDP